MSGDGRLPAHIVIPLANPATAGDLIRIGAGLLAEGGTMTAVSIVEVPEGGRLSDGAAGARKARRLLQAMLDLVPDGVDLRTVVRIGRRASEGIVELATEEDADLIVFGWGGPGDPDGEVTRGAVFSRTIEDVVRDRPCDIAVVKRRGLDPLERIMVPVRGGPHAELAMRYANALCRSFGAELEVVHVVPAGLDPTLRRREQDALDAFAGDHAPSGATARVVEGDDVPQRLLEVAREAQLVLVGASAGALDGPGAPLFGRLVERLVRDAESTVVVVRTHEAPTPATFEARERTAETIEAADKAAEYVRSLPARVDRWFAESSFHHSEFADLDRLVAAKEKQGLSISVVLPTLDEAETIGPIVRSAREELVERVPLVDELLVIDSDSSDGTPEIAAAEGARVVRHPQVLPQHGSHVGKGEALWKSLYETSGDLIAWSDTDIRDWHPRFVYGPLGPLLGEPRLGYVKAFYQRPIVEGGILTEGGGGRVTELVARPLINLFFPELSGLIQPLSGEYAGRRSILEAIPFFTGYAVEIGHLIDISDTLGLEGLGQVDLDVRIHRNQDITGLSRMSFVILQAVMRKLDDRMPSRLVSEMGDLMKLPRSSPDGLSLEVIDLADAIRPPMARIAEYRVKRGMSDA